MDVRGQRQRKEQDSHYEVDDSKLARRYNTSLGGFVRDGGEAVFRLAIRQDGMERYYANT